MIMMRTMTMMMMRRRMKMYEDRIDWLDIDSDRQHLCLGPVVKCNTKYNTTSSFDSFPLSLSPSYPPHYHHHLHNHQHHQSLSLQQ